MTVSFTGNTTNTIATNGDLTIGDTATGSFSVTNTPSTPSTLPITAPPGEEPSLILGNAAGVTGTGTITGAGSIVTLTSNGGGVNSGAFARIGNSGNGTLSILNGGKLRIEDMVGTSSVNQTALDGLTVGQNTGGTGLLTVNAGIVEVEGTGAFLNVTRNAGSNGTVNLSNGSSLLLKSRTGTNALDNALLQIGRLANSVGSVTLDNSTLTMTVDDGDNNAATDPLAGSFVNIGRDGGTGSMSLLNGSTASIFGGTGGSGINLGFDSTSNLTGTSGTATLTMTNSSMTIESNGGQGFLKVGRHNNANATMTLGSGANLSVTSDQNASLSVASQGNTSTVGLLNINAGANAAFIYDGATTSTVAASFGVGQTGTGTVNVNGGTLRFNSANSAAAANLGYGASSVGTAALNIFNGGLVEFNTASATNGGFVVGFGAGSSATVQVLSGGVLDLDGTTGQKMFLGIGSADQTTLGHVIVDGPGSAIRGVGSAVVGVNNPAFTGSGNGQLEVSNGGTFAADSLLIGNGGRLEGGGGTVTANLEVQSGGTLGDIDDALQTMAINGNVQSLGTLLFDVGATGNDRYNITGNLTLNGGTFVIDAVGGYKFTAGTTRTLASVTGTATIDPGISIANFSVTNQHVDFGYIIGKIVGGESLAIRALNSGATGGVAILDFGATSNVAALMNYNSATNAGSGSGGTLGTFLARNVDDVRGTAVADTINIVGTGAMTVFGRGGVDTINTDSGNDTLDGGAGGDTLNGGLGTDTASYQSSVTGITLNLANRAADVGDSIGDNFTSIEAFQGSEQADRFTAAAAGGQTFRGAGGADILIGGAGVDALFGDEGDDTLQGNGGNDSMNGGGGSDTIYYDAADTMANVFGGNGSDTLIFSGGSVNTAFNLVTQQFERAIHDIQDVGNANAWTRVLNEYNTSWQLSVQDIYNDNGSREYIAFDATNSQSWTRFTNFYNTAGQYYAQRIQYDAGGYDTQYIDLANNQSWSSYIDFVNASGGQYARRYFQDNGSYDTIYFDWNGTQSWFQQTEFRTAAGAMHTRQTNYDNGTYLNEYIDVNNVNSWSYYQELFNASGVRISGYGTYDNGTTFIL